MKFFYLFVTIMIAGCSTFQHHRGAYIDPVVLKKINVGQSTHDDVRHHLGAPTITSHFDGIKWYYVYSLNEQVSCFSPKLSKRHIIQIDFDQKGVVQKIFEFNEKDGKKIEPSLEKTPSGGYETSVLKEIFGNFGRYSNMDNKNK
jgi:outer membrane protein assembly factor BamE (lipoprotein component of BamABCDE complex)